MEIRIIETIHAPVEKVFALTNDIDRAMEWLPNGVRIEKLTEGPLRLGTRYRETRRILGREDVEIYEVTALDPPRRSEIQADGTQGTAGRGRFRFSVEFEAAGDSATRVALIGSATQLGCLGVVMYPVIRGILKRHSIDDLAALKSWIERQP